MRWGILGTGKISERFASALREVDGASVAAFASRSTARAEQLARGYPAAAAYGSCETLAAAEDVDVVYVATPASVHRDHCLTLLEAGKPVLCEKPFALTAAQAREIAAAARRRGVFCMEAMWMRFHPHVRRARDTLAGAELGAVAHMNAEVGYPKGDEPFADPSGGKGALLNFGVYAVSLAHFLLGAPDDVVARANLHASGVDETFSAVLRHGAAIATLSGSVRTRLSNEATVVADGGSLHLSAPFFAPTSLEVRTGPDDARSGGGALELVRAVSRRARARLRPPDTTIGFRLEAEEVMRCVRDGRNESEEMPLDRSVEVLETCDAIRSGWHQR